jgi:valyl-tRNA synthetase
MIRLSSIFVSGKHYCNKIWQATRFVENFIPISEQSKMKLLDIDEVRIFNKTFVSSKLCQFLINRLLKITIFV